MGKPGQLEWKRVKEVYGGKDTPTCSTYRAEVPGGWLVSVWSGQNPSLKNKDTNLQTWGGGVTFVPDQHHKWDLEDHSSQ